MGKLYDNIIDIYREEADGYQEKIKQTLEERRKDDPVLDSLIENKTSLVKMVERAEKKFSKLNAYKSHVKYDQKFNDAIEYTYNLLVNRSDKKDLNLLMTRVSKYQKAKGLKKAGYAAVNAGKYSALGLGAAIGITVFSPLILTGGATIEFQSTERKRLRKTILTDLKSKAKYFECVVREIYETPIDKKAKDCKDLGEIIGE